MPAASEGEAIEMRVGEVRRLPVDPASGEAGHVVVVLEEVDGGRRLPIWIGEFEGTALALHLERVEVPRPLTYAFAASVLAAAGGRVREARIARLEGEVFYATVVVEGAGGATAVDARPSDAFNLALLAGAPILADPAVLDAARSDDPRRAPETLFAEGTEGAAAIAGKMVEEWARHHPAATAPTAGEDAP